MTAQHLITILEKLLKLHKSLYQLGIEKTDVIKKGNIEALNALMKNEQAHISAIQMIEKQRQQFMAKLQPNQIEPALNDCLSLFEAAEQEQIASIQETLLLQLLQLKEVNELNQQLLEQSLQFVSLNIDLLLPEGPSNYAKEEEPDRPSLNLFDSKA